VRFSGGDLFSVIFSMIDLLMPKAGGTGIPPAFTLPGVHVRFVRNTFSVALKRHEALIRSGNS